MGQAEVSTQFRWNPENIPGKKLKGRCYEIDIETAGQKYLSQVAPRKCRPSDEQLTFYWIPNQGAPGGNCYEVDKETFGEHYSKYAGWRHCRPPKDQREYVLNEGKCFLVGQFKGVSFLQAVNYDHCKSDQISYQFILANSGTRGTCHEVDRGNGVTKIISLEKCKPKGEGATQFIWEPTKGICYEVATQGGPAVFISSANKTKCRPKEVSYEWLQADAPECFEVGQGANGILYRSKVSHDHCLKDIPREVRFLKTSPISGSCIEVDSETGGVKVRRAVVGRKCRDKVKELATRIISYRDRNYCIEYDKKNPVEGYRRTVDTNKCNEETKRYRWQQDEENPFKGKCLKLSYYLDKEVWNGVRKEYCKPDKTIFFWHKPRNYPSSWVKDQRREKNLRINLDRVLASKDNLIFFGKCYQVAAKDGPGAFSVEAETKDCKPRGDNATKIRYFHPRDFLKGGCYLVDAKTEGEKYLQKILNRECKDEFLKTKSQIEEDNRDYGP